MTDLEICKRIAKIERHFVADTRTMMEFGCSSGVWICGELSTKYGELITDSITPFNPLTDDALCFRLMVKYRVLIAPEYDGSTLAQIRVKDNNYARALNKNPNKAICLAIIGAHEND